MKAGCVFLVVFWCRYCGWFSSRFSSRFSFRFSVRSSFRPSFRSSPRFVSRFALRLVSSFRSSVRSPFRPSVRFSVSSVSGGRFVERAVFVSSLWRVVLCSLSCLCAVVAMRVRVSSMWSVQWMAGCGRQCVVSACRVAGCEACCSARCWAGRDDRLMARRCSPCCSFAYRSFVFSCRLSGRGGEAIDAPFLSARLGGLSGGGLCAVGDDDVIGMSLLFVSRVGRRGDGVSSRSSSRFSSRRASRLAFRCGVSCGVSLCFSFSRLVVAFCRLVSFRSCVVLVADVCGDVVRGSSHVGSILSLASRFVPPSCASFRPSSCSHFVSSCSCRYRGGDAARVRRGGDVIFIM